MEEGVGNGEVGRPWACGRRGRMEQSCGSVEVFSVGVLHGRVEGLRKVRFVAEVFFRKSEYGWPKACVKSKIQVQGNLDSLAISRRSEEAQGRAGFDTK